MAAQMEHRFRFDIFPEIRAALSPEHAELEAENVISLAGGMPAKIALHTAINSPQMHRAAQGDLPRPGENVRASAYLRGVSRLCDEVAQLSESEIAFEEQVAAAGDILTDSVGRKAKNLVDDVKLVQALLNSNLPLPSPALAENGAIDDATIAAIENYQRTTLGSKSPDGRIDRNGSTFNSLVAPKLAFLAHRCQPLTGHAVSVDAAQMNPGFLTASGTSRDAGLQAIVDRRILSKTKLAQLRFAIVDLTGSEKLAKPLFAGNRETLQGGLGSMSKIACMYAAYQLKFDLEELSRQNSITVEKDLFAAARDLWRAARKPDPANVAQLFPSDPRIERQGNLIVIDGKPVLGPPGLSLPDLEQIFSTAPDGAGGLTVHFKGSDRIFVDPGVTPRPANETTEVKAYSSAGGESLGEVRKLSFAERLFLMIDKSDNAAAHSCLEKLGFLYLTSAIWQADFYRPERGGGLWEASTHDGGVRWMKPPVPRGNPKSDFVSANACSIAALFTLIEQGRLVNREACDGMKHLMNKRKASVLHGSHTRSYFLEALGPLFPLDRIHSKLGIGDFRNDAAIIVRTVHPDPDDESKSKQIRYVAAAFDEPVATTPNLHQFIIEADKCIRENNGLLAASAP